MIHPVSPLKVFYELTLGNRKNSEFQKFVLFKPNFPSFTNTYVQTCHERLYFSTVFQDVSGRMAHRIRAVLLPTLRTISLIS